MLKYVLPIAAVCLVAACSNKSSSADVAAPTPAPAQQDEAPQGPPVDLASVHFPRFEVAANRDSGRIWLPGSSYQTGFICFDGEITHRRLPSQVVYRLKVINSAGGSSVRITAYHISGVTELKGATQAKYDFGEPRDQACPAPFIISQLEGHEGSIEYFLDKKPSVSFDETLTESPADLEKLVRVYSPIFRAANAGSHSSIVSVPFFGSDIYKDVDNTDAVAMLMTAMKHAKTLGGEKAGTIEIIKIGESNTF